MVKRAGDIIPFDRRNSDDNVLLTKGIVASTTGNPRRVEVYEREDGRVGMSYIIDDLNLSPAEARVFAQCFLDIADRAERRGHSPTENDRAAIDPA